MFKLWWGWRTASQFWSEARIEAPRPTGCQDWQRQFNCAFKKGKDSEEKRENAAKKRKWPGLKKITQNVYHYLFLFFLVVIKAIISLRHFANP
jgi:polyferredoxin